MRLKRIELYDNFRSLQSGFILNFIEDKNTYDSNQAINPYCLVGRNGSGKSNILELLSAIFYQVEVNYINFLPKEKVKIKLKNSDITDEDNYEIEEVYQELTVFQSFDTKPNAYKLEYYITQNDEEKLITIEKKEKQAINIYFEDKLETPISGLEAKNVLPEYIVGYSSGQNEILSLPFYKIRLIQYDEYLDYLKRDENFANHESRMIYLDDAFSQAIFITNFIFTDNVVNEVFKDTIGVESVESFRIVINKDIKGIVEEQEKLLIDNVIKKIELLKSCATMYYEVEEKNQLILDYYLDKVVKEAFRLQFGNKLELFKTFQILTNLNYYHTKEQTKLKFYNSDSLYAKGYLPQAPWNERFFGFKYFNLKKVGVKDTVLSRSLSDGEYQFLHSIGLALIYRDTQSLFLLDEPETHFNPSWRAEYMSVLKKCFTPKHDEKPYAKAEFLITSHSPFIVSDTKEDNVIFFEKDENLKVERKQISFNTFGASVNQITFKIFGTNDSMGNVSKNILDTYREEIDKSNNLKGLMQNIENELGESVEKIILIKAIYDKLEKQK